jgi:hypothetical protein
MLDGRAASLEELGLLLPAAVRGDSNSEPLKWKKGHGDDFSI